MVNSHQAYTIYIWSYHAREGVRRVNDLTDNFMKEVTEKRQRGCYFSSVFFFFLLFAFFETLCNCCHCSDCSGYPRILAECIACNCLFDGPNNFD